MDFVLICFVTILSLTTEQEVTDFTLPVQARVQLLKDAINKDLNDERYNNNQRPILARITPVNTENFDYIGADYDYEDDSKITPVMDTDERKTRGKNALKRIKVKRTTPLQKSVKQIQFSNQLRADNNLTAETGLSIKKHKKKHPKSPNLRFKDIFYRRFLSNIPVKDRQFLHCIDLLSPFILGHKNKMTDVKRLPPSDPVVMRLVQLIKEGTTEHTKDDIRSILYQISNLSIRFFQWEISSMHVLLEALFTHEHTNKYTFLTLKRSIKKLFSSWQLDLSNTSALLRQSKIFRPPCVLITPNTGSTKSPSSVSYKKEKPLRSKIPCLEYSNENDRNNCESYYDKKKNK